MSCSSLFRGMLSFTHASRTLVDNRLFVYIGGLVTIGLFSLLEGFGMGVADIISSTTVVVTLIVMGLTYGMELHFDGVRTRGADDTSRCGTPNVDYVPRQRYMIVTGVAGIPPGIYLLVEGIQPVAGLLFLAGAFFILHRSGRVKP
ncbi:hypothetical protein [Haladaptatus sp. DFWS20]|uniref:hypothetical protein n=1 Tax=Haladaptatus sp. DFWS20 TaxID=3403467 RepID=UPI003EBFD596